MIHRAASKYAFLVTGFWLLMLVGAWISCGYAADALPKSAVTLPNGAVYSVEVPQTQAERERGLMFRSSLAPRNGMLFIFPQTGPLEFWMKNTLIPLDLIWLNEQKRVVYIRPEAPPCKADPCPTYSPGVPSRYVLEIPAGAAKQEGLGLGSLLKF